MYNPESEAYFRNRTEYVEGPWLTFSIPYSGDVARLAKDGDIEYHEVFSGEYTPNKIHSIIIDASQERNGSFDYLGIKAEFEFSPMSMLNDRDWQDKIIGELVNTAQIRGGEYLNFVHSPHEPGVAYVQIDDLTTLRVQVTTEDINSGVLDVRAIRTDEIRRLLPHLLPNENMLDNRMLVVREPYEYIRHGLEVFNKTTNKLVEAITSRKDQPSRARRPIVLEIAPLIDEPITRPQPITPAEEVVAAQPEGSNHGFTETFDQIGGAHLAKKRLKEIAFAIQNRELAKQHGLHPNHFLLYGPPGTGKTSLIKAFINEIDAHLIQIDSTDIGEKWIHQSAENMKKVFKKARSINTDRPIVIFIDEFDSLGTKGKIHSTEDVEVKNVLKQELSNTNSSDSNIIVVGATNAEISTIDSALIRPGRLEKIYVETPSEDELVEIWFGIYAQSYFDLERQFDEQLEWNVESIENKRFDFYELARKMAEVEMTGAHVVEIVRRARTIKMSGIIGVGKNVSEIPEQDRLLTHKELLQAFEQLRKS